MANTISKAGKKKLEAELEYLRTVRRKEVAEQLKEARSFGDLSENAEYDEAKNEQAKLEAEIEEKTFILANAVVVDDDDISIDEIGVGSIMKIQDLETKDIETYMIVGTTEADPMNNKISDESPIGKSALKKKVGDVFEVDAPIGIIKFEVLEISKPEKSETDE